MVSIGTVRHAIDILVTEKVLGRQQGKGTKVADSRWLDFGSKINRVHHNTFGDNIPWGIEELEFKTVIADGPIAARLKLRDDAKSPFFRGCA